MSIDVNVCEYSVQYVRSPELGQSCQCSGPCRESQPSSEDFGCGVDTLVPSRCGMLWDVLYALFFFTKVE